MSTMNCDMNAFPGKNLIDPYGNPKDDSGLSKIEWAAITIAAGLIAAGKHPAEVETLAVNTAQNILKNCQP